LTLPDRGAESRSGKILVLVRSGCRIQGQWALQVPIALEQQKVEERLNSS
jgi:hypothetical protein